MIRLYKKEDINRIVELEHAHLESSLGEEYYLKDLKNPFARHYVYEKDHFIIGFISSIFDGTSLEILNFVIDRNYQSLGYGSKLLAFLLDELISFELHDVSLEVRNSNQKAISLYEKFGFKPIRIRKQYYKNGDDAYFMQKLYDEKSYIANLEANLFSKKEGRKYSSDFKERYCLNYYDLYDYKIDSLKNFPYDSYILFLSNWFDKKLFDEFDISCCALMHVNAYLYQSLSKTNHSVCYNNLTGYQELCYQINLEYGHDYALKYTKYSMDKISKGEIKLFSVLLENKMVGMLTVIESKQSIFVYGLYVDENNRNQGIASNLMDACINYAKKEKKCEIYLEAEIKNTPIEMYKKMNFKQIEILYEIFKEH